jgi:hypothetical protein
VVEYYRHLQGRRPSSAYKHFALSGWDYDRWKRVLYGIAGCARVNRAETTWKSGTRANVQVDLCVEDKKEGEVHRWTGSVGMKKQSGGQWAMSDWSGLNRAGTCSSSCRP